MLENIRKIKNITTKYLAKEQLGKQQDNWTESYFLHEEGINLLTTVGIMKYFKLFNELS